MNLVAEAVKGVREETVNYIVNQEIAYIERLLKTLEENDNDIMKAFPYPKGYESRGEYMSKKNVHNFVLSRLTKNRDEKTYYSRRMGDPYYRVRDEEAIAKHIEVTRRDANLDFDKYVIKLTKKIGLDDVESVKLDDVHRYLWNYSFLYVVRKNGEKETWKTQCIYKQSCLGTNFNQWPTRKMKK